MNTITNSVTFISSEAETKTKSTTALSEFLDSLEAARFGFVPLILVVMACLGGIAAAFAVQQSEIQLMAVAITTSFVEVLVIAIAPMRLIAIACVLAFIVDLFVFIF